MKILSVRRACLTIALTIALVASAAAQHLGDIEIHLDGGRLVTENPGGVDRVYVNEFDDLGGVLFTDEPGFESDTNALPAGATIGFNVLDALWYWDGAALAEAPTPAILQFALDDNTVNVTAASDFQAGFAIATASSSGTMHTHPSYSLAPSDAPAGVYGIVLELTSPGWEPSLPFLIAFNLGIEDLVAIESGVTAIAFASGVSSPDVVPGDTDADGDVDLTDLNNVRNHFGASSAELGDTAPFDSRVDLADLNNVRNHFGTAANVPEPTALNLLFAALTAACACRRSGRR